MALKDNASLALIPAAYKTSKVYSAIPTDGDGDFTFSRISSGTRTNKAGLVQTMSTNVPRLDYLENGVLQSCPSLLLEPTRTNYALDSNDISVWTNTISGGSITSTANYATSPDGSNTATRLQMTATSYAMKNESTTSIVGNYAATIYLKSNTGLNQEVAIYGRNTPVTSYTVTSQWQRFEINGSATSGQSSYINFGVNIGAGSDATLDILAWGGQIEAGSYATSLIPNPTGTDITRTEDFCYINSGLQNILNTSQGTLFVDLEVPRVATISDFDRIVLSDQTSSTDRIILDNFGGNWRSLMISSAGVVARTIVSVTANQRIKVAIAYSSTQLRISYNGNTATTTSGSYTPTTTLESFKFSNVSGGSKCQGKIYQAMYFNTALTNTELQTLTS